MTDAVQVSELRPGIARLLLDRPDRLNAIDDATIEALHDALDRIAATPAWRVVVLTGAGRGFCAGFDLRSGDYDGDPDARGVHALVAGQTGLSNLTARIRELPAAVVAAVNGPAAGGGFALATAADVRVASTTARFLVANVRIGISGGEMGLSHLLPRLIGLSRATELMLTGREMAADEALACGLVSAVVEPDTLPDAALEVAQRIAANSAFGVWMTKELLAGNAAPGLREALRAEDRTQVLCNYSPDLAAAIEAFRRSAAGERA